MPPSCFSATVQSLSFSLFTYLVQQPVVPYILRYNRCFADPNYSAWSVTNHYSYRFHTKFRSPHLFTHLPFVKMKPISHPWDGVCENGEIETRLESFKNSKPVIIGLYGLPGSGKSFLLATLRQGLDIDDFTFYDGSEIIAAVTDGGLEGFQTLDDEKKTHCRERAIMKIRQECDDSGKSALVAGHAIFWNEEEETGGIVCTQADLRSYTHILYLDVPVEKIAEYRRNDQKRSRPPVSITHLAKWQIAERQHLREVCRSYDIIFAAISPHHVSMNKLIPMIRDFCTHTEDLNTELAEQQLDKIMSGGSETPETVLVFDADKTLAPQDSAELFWELVSSIQNKEGEYCPLKKLFSGPLQYSYIAFRQATMLCEETIDDKDYDACCGTVAQMIEMHPEILDVLNFMKGQAHVRALVLTCGLKGVWKRVLEKAHLSDKVRIIGGGRLSDGLVMTPALKATLVARLRNLHNCYVWAFGDSPLDLKMLRAANQAVVVTGEEYKRSTTMNGALTKCIGTDGFQPRQAVLPCYARPRLDVTQLPLVQLTDHFFLDSIFIRRKSLHVLHATDRPAAKLLMTPMRDGEVSGPALRETHRRVGWYLAVEFYADIIGLEKYPIRHVQGYQTDGHRLFNEKETLIVPLMRGGEPMALGVNDALPLAMFLHAKVSSDIKAKHVQSCNMIVLVDSVINSGKSILEFVQHIRHLHKTIRIVVVAGVIQAQCVSASMIAHELCRFRGLSFIALRLSDNKFTGKGTTDTGNRLFNTVHLD